MKLGSILIILLILMSCKWTVYRYELSNKHFKYDMFILQKKKGEFEIHHLERLEKAYYMNLYDGISKDIVENELHLESIVKNRFEKIEIQNLDSGFLYTYLNQQDSIVQSFQPLHEWNCFETKTFILNRFDGTGFANNTSHPWFNFYAKKVADTIYYFDTELPHPAYYVEYAPFNNNNANDSCYYMDPVKVFIDKKIGLPLRSKYLDYRFDGETLFDSYISCQDIKHIRMRKKRLLKLLFN